MQLYLPELIVSGRRLGRIIDHDRRSLDYLLRESDPAAASWPRHIPILDQGDLGSCTGNAATGALGSGPHYDALGPELTTGLKLDEPEAVSIYSDAEKLDGGPGLPSEDNGSSGLSVAKVCKTRQLISGYQHATSVDAAHTALKIGPFLAGTNWMTGMDNPTSEGIVQATGTIRGGHEYLCREYDPVRDLFWFDNSWGTSYGLAGRFAYDSPTLTKLLAAQGDVTSFVPLSLPAPTPNPPSPITPTDVNVRAFHDAVLPWAHARHVASNKAAAQAALHLFAAEGLST